MPKEELAILIQAALKKAGHESVYSAAKAIEMDSKQLWQIVEGKVSPSIDTLERIFQPLGWEVTVNFFPHNSR